MDFYSYIATKNPRAARSVIQRFGYQINDTNISLGENLKTLVRNEGEPALVALAEIHPDKNLILELFGSKNEKACDCSGRISKLEQFMHFTGSSPAKQVENQTGIIFMGAALLIAAAIIVKR